MMAWSTKHDEWIAEHCEGWMRITAGPCAGMWKRPDRVENIGVPNYITNPAAAIRAAEAWEAKVDGRGWTINSRRGYKVANLHTVPAHPNNFHIVSSDWQRSTAAALAQALYRATGGPE